MAQWWTPSDGGAGFDVLLTPTLAARPPLVGAVDGDHPDPWHTLAAATPYAAFTLPFNMSGQPAVSLPLGWSEDGIPIGSQLVAAAHREDVLLGLAVQLEEPWRGPGSRGAAA